MNTKEDFVSKSLLPRDTGAMLSMRKNKRYLNINDEIEKLHAILWNNDDYYALLDAVSDADAMEGSTFCDDVCAAQMIKALAAESGNSYIATKPLAAIVIALRVVLRRYELSRSQRREKLAGLHVVTNGDTESVGDIKG